MAIDKNRRCLACNLPLHGRQGKKYCDPHCKSNYQYQQIKKDVSSVHYKISKQLKTNYSILKSHNKAGKATITAKELVNLGFNPRVFTHHWKTSKGNTYLFVYDYGFMKILDNRKTKYSIVKWQAYMNKQIGL